MFGLLFVTVAARIVGIVGVTSQPTSGIALVTLLGTASVFVAAGWVDAGARAAVLTVGTVVAIAASKAGDISQDLKTGFLVGATPARQQFGQLIGAAFACWAVAATVLLLGATYSSASKEIPAPQATLMKTIIEGVLAGQLPWDLVLTGGGLSIGAMLCGVSGLAFAIGVYLPLSTMAPLFVGGCVRALADRGRAKGSGGGGRRARGARGSGRAGGVGAGRGRGAGGRGGGRAGGGGRLGEVDGAADPGRGGRAVQPAGRGAGGRLPVPRVALALSRERGGGSAREAGHQADVELDGGVEIGDGDPLVDAVQPRQNRWGRGAWG